MRPRAWSLSAACALALLAVVALVAWRGPGLAPAWSSALRTTAVVAVVALAMAALICGAVALRPPPPDRVSIAVPPDAPPATTVAPHPGPGRWLVAALALAVLGAVPVLLVLVLSATGAAGAAAGSASGPVTTSPATLGGTGTAAPTTSSGTGPSPSSGTTSPPVTSDPGAAGTPPVPSGPSPSGTSPSNEDPPPSTLQPPAAPGEAAAGPSSSGCDVVVVLGDALWDLARARLPPGATPTQVAAATQALYVANAAVVGADPDLILPGQVLDVCA